MVRPTTARAATAVNGAGTIALRPEAVGQLDRKGRRGQRCIRVLYVALPDNPLPLPLVRSFALEVV